MAGYCGRRVTPTSKAQFAAPLTPGLFVVDIGKLFIYTPFINSTERNQMSTAIAQTILAQLGGNRFLAMTGAKQLCDSLAALFTEQTGFDTRL